MAELPSRVFFRQGSAVAKPGRNHLLRTAVAPLGHPLPRSAIDNRVKGPVRRLAIFISAWLERRAELRALQCLDDQMLKDVGVSRGDIEREVRRKWYDV
jgi:uncharacterized protein YjiS (DUF1127 family)